MPSPKNYLFFLDNIMSLGNLQTSILFSIQVILYPRFPKYSCFYPVGKIAEKAVV